MKLEQDTIDLLCAAFLSRAGQPEDYHLLFIKKGEEFAPAFKQVLGVSLTDLECDAVLSRLIDIGIFARVQDRFTKGFIHVVGRPRERLEHLAQDKSSPYYFAEKLGKDWLTEALRSPALLAELSDPDLEFVSPIAPASDRLVTLDHNSQNLAKTVDLIEVAEEAVRGANSVDQESTSWIRDHIQAGLKLMTGKKVILSAISALILKPLLAAYEAVSEEPVKNAIMAAIQAIRTLFGI